MECRLSSSSYEVCSFRTLDGLMSSFSRRVWMVEAAAIVSSIDGVENKSSDVVDEIA